MNTLLAVLPFVILIVWVFVEAILCDREMAKCREEMRKCDEELKKCTAATTDHHSSKATKSRPAG